MAQTETKLPEEVESRLEDANFDKKLTQQHVAQIFVHGDRPHYSVAQMDAALDTEAGTDTVRSRLEELEERDVLKSETVNNGDVYWWKRKESDWPIPPDVVVEKKETEITLSEWKQKPHVRLAALSVFTAILGTAVTLVGTFEAGGLYQLPIEADNIIAAGLSAGIISYAGLFLSGFLWLLDDYRITEDLLENLSD